MHELCVFTLVSSANKMAAIAFVVVAVSVGCDDENAVANTKRAKNASKLLESWKIEFCVPPGRTLRTAQTSTHTHSYA